MVTTEGYMFFPPLVGSDGETQKLKKLNHKSFFGNPLQPRLSYHYKKFFAQVEHKFIYKVLNSTSVQFSHNLYKNKQEQQLNNSTT